MKEGFFEWIADFDQLEPFISRACESLTDGASHKKEKKDVRVLEIGCGTSTLSQALSERAGLGEVIAIDNDPDCVAHMQRLFPPAQSAVRYRCFDMTDEPHTETHTHSHTDTHAHTDTQTQAHTHSDELSAHSFDLVIDKGTFDAILVEGSVASMIQNVLRFLSLHGVYLLFSINKSLLLEELFQYTPLGLKTIYQTTVVISNQEIAVFLLQKEFHSSLTTQEIADHEREVMDLFFQIEKPLLTQEEEERIRRAFAEHDLEGKGVPLGVAYKILFAHKEELGYDYALFLEDVENISLQNEDKMTLEEVLRFVQLMQ